MHISRRLTPLLASLIVACTENSATPPPSSTHAANARELDSLRALGYTDWDSSDSELPEGVVLHDPQRTTPGINIRCDDRDRVLAEDLQGQLLRAWRIPGRSQVEFALPLGSPPTETRPESPAGLIALSVDEGLTRIDRDGRVLWQVDFHAHHDIAQRLDGSFLVPEWEEHEDYHGRRVRFDKLVHLSAQGSRLGSWSTFERRADLQRLHPPSVLDSAPATADAGEATYDYYHLNSVAVLPPSAADHGDERLRPGNLLVCLRNQHLVLILDGSSFEVLWHWGPGQLDSPHMPSLTPEGRILIFDNGRRRGHSRVIEVDPATDRVLWTYRADPPSDFYSEIRGACQRLPSGNTLITESERGRAFEITPDGERVWQYLNPDRQGAQRRRIYRLLRYPARDLSALLE